MEIRIQITGYEEPEQEAVAAEETSFGSGVVFFNPDTGEVSQTLPRGGEDSFFPLIHNFFVEGAPPGAGWLYHPSWQFPDARWIRILEVRPVRPLRRRIPEVRPPGLVRFLDFSPDLLPVEPGPPPIFPPISPGLLPRLTYVSFDLLTHLVSISCSGDPDPACFDPSNPLLTNQCSFAAPLLCDHVAAFSLPARVFHGVQVDRARLRDRKRGTRVLLKGYLDSEELPLDTEGRFTVMLGEQVESLDLAEFRTRHGALKWKGRSGTLRKVLLRPDGSFRISLRKVPHEKVEDLILPFLVNVAGTAGGGFIRLE